MLRILLIPSLLLLLITGAGFYATGTKDQVHTITVASNAEINTLDPGKMSWAMDIRAAMCLWEGLTGYDPQTLDPVPAVAQSWDISADRLTYTFHLRPEARWSNGDPVTAGDFVFAWQRNLRPATAAEYLNMLLVLQGAKTYYEALTKDPQAEVSVAGLVVVDPHTLVVRLQNPCTYFLDLLAFPPFYPLHEKSMNRFLPKGDPAQGYDNHWTRPPNLVSNGPYQLTDWQFKRYLQLDHNPYYWDRSAVRNPRLHLVAYEDSRAAFLAQQSGAVDVLTWVPPDFGPELLTQVQQGKRHDVHFGPVFGSYYYIFNCQKKPFDDRRVRKALALAIDKKALVEQVVRMGQRPLDVLIPPESLPGYVSPRGVGMNLVEARRLLAEAGYPEGVGLPPVELLYNTENFHSKVAQAIGQMWQNNLHIPVVFRGTENSTFRARRQSQNFMVARGGWYGDYRDATTWLDLARSKDGNNDGRYASPRYDALMEQSDAEADPARRNVLLADAERMLVEEDFAYIPLYQYSDGLVYDPRKIGGVEFNVRMLLQLKNVYKK